MNVGTRSLLIGAHQFLWHPITVFFAWCELYGLPNWKECVCIFIHDIGYWEKWNMDGGPTKLPNGEYDYTEGYYHPLLAARLASNWLDNNGEIEWSLGGCDPDSNDCFKRDPDYRDRKVIRKCDNIYAYLCLFHSRSIAAQHGKEPSKLCWVDKLAVRFDPWWLYLPRVILSGEIHEYRKRAADFGEVPISVPNIEWYKWARARMMRKAYARDTRPAYTKGSSTAPDKSKDL